MSTTVQRQVLINARARIADPRHWTSGTLACAPDGQQVAWYDSSARRWCAMGAIYRAAFELLGDQKEATRIGNDVIKRLSPAGASHLRGYLPTLNDREGHGAVLAAFDRALGAGLPPPSLAIARCCSARNSRQ